MNKLQNDKKTLTQLLLVAGNIIDSLSNEQADDEFIAELVSGYLNGSTRDAIIFRVALAELVSEHLEEYTKDVATELRRIERYEKQTSIE